jgi:hypothetical protein
MAIGTPAIRGIRGIGDVGHPGIPNTTDSHSASGIPEFWNAESLRIPDSPNLRKDGILRIGAEDAAPRPRPTKSYVVP